MASKSVVLLSLWGLSLFVCGVTSFCNVTCSTDYIEMVNCSCSASLPAAVLVTVTCRNYELVANGSCQIQPPKSWCAVYTESIDEVASVGTMCNTTVAQLDGQTALNDTESSQWELSKMVKASPPFDVRVTKTDRSYNITWEHENKDDYLTYEVRIREKGDVSKNPPLSFIENKKLLLLEHQELRPYVHYIVDVRAKFNTDNFFCGPWSEWSSSAEWTEGRRKLDIEGTDQNWWCALLFIVPVVCVIVIFSQKSYLCNKLQLITYIPKPDEFFEPLYHTYKGNFKEWVKSPFIESDYQKVSPHVQEKSEKQPDVLQWKNENRSSSEDNEMKQAGHKPQPQCNSLLYFQEGGSAQSAGHSSGHISIHTVTLSGEEEFEEEVQRSRSPVNTLRSYRDGESFGLLEEHPHSDLEERRISRLDRLSGMLPQHENQISNDLSLDHVSFEPHAHIDEPERVSLDSFVSQEQSEDGYPHVDLDTIDSGFGECSSPGAADSNMAVQMDLFQDHKSSNSNYVKQWMICSTIHEDSGNTENEILETQ
ncbi:interleukin 21 receptor%2C tandem duplicate 1 [Xyrichtys novacula]|uniref:Interleukin 21 receptor, tandem duplicate 1 n=1 Tax=Xyrichtys novacula TaxID=13765 RepID=A0AAV1FR53_XYRNO|nr:interleukin 21 receptor%2C tandem duplicate 1 [Xyrichtys novacula]